MTSTQNEHHKVGEVLAGEACFFFYRGWLRVDDDGHYYVGPGHGAVVEIYDRCDTSIWFQLSEAEIDSVADAVQDFSRLIKANN